MTSLGTRLPPAGRNLFIAAAPLWIKRAVCRGARHHCVLCETDLNELWPFGPKTAERPSVRCPVCGSLERHRFIWRYLEEHTELLSPRRKRLLHFAPERCLERRFSGHPSLEYVTADVRPGKAMLALDITNIALADASFDFVLCSHVLEHVNDDAKAMRELRRILVPGGIAIVLVPIREGRTLEDPSATTPESRRRIYGQSDHVRHYGRDIGERLEAARFRVTTVLPADAMPRERCAREGMSNADLIFRCEAT